MAKPGDWNAEVLQALELAGGLTHGLISVTTTAAVISSVSTNILWLIVQNLGSANVFVGASNVASSGALQGLQIGPSGETPVLRVSNLNMVWLVAASGTQSVAYLAGTKI